MFLLQRYIVGMLILSTSYACAMEESIQDIREEMNKIIKEKLDLENKVVQLECDVAQLECDQSNSQRMREYFSTPHGQLTLALSSCSKLNHPFITSGLGFIIYILYHPHIANPTFKQKLLLSLRDGLFATGLSSILVRNHKNFNGFIYLPTYMLLDCVCWFINKKWHGKNTLQESIDEFGVAQKEPTVVDNPQGQPTVGQTMTSFLAWILKTLAVHGLLEITAFN